jgi:tryptophan synthase beta chain
MNFSGHGIIDLPSYDAYMSGKLQDYVLPNEEIQRLLKDLENYPKLK